jgi:ribosomal protein S12 methylthiotransferase accessory factor
LEAIFPGNKRVDVIDGKFVIKTDQKESNGGGSSAPEPFHLLLASIVSCAGIYAKVFCDSRKLNSDGMKVTQKISYNRATKMMDAVKLVLYVPSDFPKKYETSILKSMNSCAVKKQLHPDISFVSEMARLS